MSSWASRRRVRPSIAEEDVGIHNYLSPTVAGIGGKLKVIPADFRVNELRRDGSEVRLDDDDDDAETQAAPGSDDDAYALDSDYVGFTLRKQQHDTLGAISILSELLGVPTRCFSFAGLKDYRAVTTQEMAVRGVDLESVRELGATTQEKLGIGHVHWRSHKMHLGGCGGNRFRIVLRQARGGRAAKQAVRALRRSGFINYYGLQRFGGGAARNDAVGLCALQARSHRIASHRIAQHSTAQHSTA